jgi:hypothetical protein
MESKKINQLATELTPALSDLTIIGDPSTGISKKITLSQMASLFTGTVEEYATKTAFPLVGVADTIYIALDTNVLWRWDTGLTSYVELSPNIINSLVFSDANGFDGTISLVGSTATLTITTALTTGSVPFIGASGALTQDNANLFFDDTNNRLGINTNAPTTALDVFGSGIIGRINGTSTNNAFLGFSSAGSNKWSVGNVQSDNRFRIYSETNTAELVSVLQTGEFGIGIANPTTKFHIDGGASALIANLDANVSVAKSLSFRSDNSNRFNIEVSGTESGSNAGANLFIRRYSDAGALIDTPLTITRSTGAISLTGALSGTSASFSSTVSASNGTLIGGTGTTNKIARFNGTGSISDSNINDEEANAINIVKDAEGITSSIVRIFPVTGTRASVLSLSNNGDGEFSVGRQNSAGNSLLVSSLGAYDSVVGHTGSQTLHLVTGNLSRLAITGTGNIGIGTSSITPIGSSTNRALVINAPSGNASQIILQEGTINYANIYGYGGDAGFLTTAAIPLILGTNSTERMRINSTGLVGVGTTDIDAQFKVFSNSATNLILATTTKAAVNIVAQKQGVGYTPLQIDAENQQFLTNGSEKMRITSGGNVGIGTSSPGSKLTVYNTSGATLSLQKSSGAGSIDFGSDTTSYALMESINGGGLVIYTGNGSIAERMRVTSGGYAKFSNNGAYVYPTNSFFEVNQSVADWTQVNVNKVASGTPLGIFIGFTALSPNSTSAPFIQAQDSTAERFTVRSNGGIANYQANDVNLSDERTKKDIIPLESYWDKFKAIEIVKFKYKDQTHDDFNIGVIAQQVEKVAPEFIDIDSWGKTKIGEDVNKIIIDEEPIKSVYTSDLHHATIKVLQEAMAKIETLEEKIKQLENK